MSDPTTLRALAERVERLTAPCRETDAEIAWLLMPGDRKRLGPPGLRRECFHLGLSEPAWVAWETVAHFAAAYTASLDAAAGLYLVLPDEIPSDPRKATAAALRARAAEMEANNA